MAEAGQRPFPGWEPEAEGEEGTAPEGRSAGSDEPGGESGVDAGRRWRDIVHEEERSREGPRLPGSEEAGDRDRRAGSGSASIPLHGDAAPEPAPGRGSEPGERRGGPRAEGAPRRDAPPRPGRPQETLTPWSDPLEDDVDRLRHEARRAAREDAEAGVPSPEGVDQGEQGEPESERALRERCRALFERWKNRELTRYREVLAAAEEKVSERLTEASLGIDRFERLTSELRRLKVRMRIRRDEVRRELEGQAESARGLTTRVYVTALVFLGCVEFFANAPVFSALLPRDPLTERQIQLVQETSEGWLAGAERVLAQILLRPDAALLAAGVVTFLCVLAHFFGHSLRDLIIKRDRAVRKEAVSSRTPLENVVPMVLTGLGLVLVLGVLFEARVTLGEVGERRFDQDMAQVEELRRQADWLRADGDLLEANQRTNRADDLEEAATDLREYAASMSRMSFPILLLNLTLVLCALSAAYFHRTDYRPETFSERPFEEERSDLIEQAEASAEKVSRLLAEAVRGLRELRGHVASRPLAEWRSVRSQLESVVALYRSENGRVRGIDPATIPAFRSSSALDVELEEEDRAAANIRDPEAYEQERQRLTERFERVRERFTQEVMSQDLPDAEEQRPAWEK